jgi:hypothetical protein
MTSRFVLICFIALLSSSVHAQPEAWTPKVEFSLEDASFSETMHWISGWSYALTEVGKASARSGNKGQICLPAHGYVESRILLGWLNKNFKGKRITSEQAAAVLWAGASVHYRCGKRL